MAIALFNHSKVRTVAQRCCSLFCLSQVSAKKLLFCLCCSWLYSFLFQGHTISWFLPQPAWLWGRWSKEEPDCLNWNSLCSRRGDVWMWLITTPLCDLSLSVGNILLGLWTHVINLWLKLALPKIIMINRWCFAVNGWDWHKNLDV